MFADISKNYDSANHLMSLGVDKYWRWQLARLVAAKRPNNVADLATGSGDVAFALRQKLPAHVEVRGFDFCAEMLKQAEAKQAHLPPADRIIFAQADCMDLSAISGRPFDVCTIAFGVRNFSDRMHGFSQIRECLKDGGSLFVLEFSQPYAWLKPLYRVYLKYILPAMVKCLTKNAAAYRYLTDSINAFPEANQITDELRRSGFCAVKVWRLTGGIVAIHEAVR